MLYITEPTLKSKACFKCLYFTKIISDLCRYLEYSDPNAWHNQFYSLVTTKIDEEIFKPLFPEGKKSGRPNASIRILVAMSVLKEGFGCSDEDLFEKCEFDLLTRKALGMELLTDVTPSIDTYYLFRRRICEYQERTGIDLMQPIVPRTTKRCKAM